VADISGAYDANDLAMDVEALAEKVQRMDHDRREKISNRSG
jgi:hypothetical protein